MRAPQLTTCIDIYRLTGQRDMVGAQMPTEYAYHDRRYARVTYRSASSEEMIIDASQRVPVVTAIMIVRLIRHDPVRPDDRIQYDGFWWDIKAIVPYNTNPLGYVELLAKRGGYPTPAESRRPQI